MLAEDAWVLVGDAPPATGTAADWEALRIAEGVPRWGADMGPDLLPMEAGLEPVAISYSKGCYIGQEVIQRVKTYSEPPRMLVALDLDTPLPAGTALGDGAGTLTSVSGLKGLGVVRKEHQAPGTRLAPGVVVRALPWRSRIAT
jgi:folate-binding protein YgfZ